MTNDCVGRRGVLVGSASVTLAALGGCLGDDEADEGIDDDSDATDQAAGDDEAMDADVHGATRARADGIPEELPTNPGEEDFVDMTGEEAVLIVTRDGEEAEADWVFDAPFVLVDPETTVHWLNEDGAFHTVTSIPNLDDIDSGGEVFQADLGEAGDTFQWDVPEESGVQPYYCEPHLSFMWGAVAIADDGAFPTIDEDPAGDDTDANDETDDQETEDLPTDPDEDDFVDMTGEDEVEIITRRGEGTEPDFIFDPPFVRVDQGTEIQWVNTDGIFHTVTSTDSLNNRSGGGSEFDTTISSEGDTFEWTADVPGRQDYYCSPHAGFMFGSIDVVETD